MELLDLDNDALEYIYTKLNWRDLWNLSTTCNRFRFLYPHIEVNQAKLVKQAMRKIKEIDYSIYIDMYGIQKSERMQENIVVRYDFTPGISYQLRNEFGHEDENLSISYGYINDDQEFLRRIFNTRYDSKLWRKQIYPGKSTIMHRNITSNGVQLTVLHEAFPFRLREIIISANLRNCIDNDDEYNISDNDEDYGQG